MEATIASLSVFTEEDVQDASTARRACLLALKSPETSVAAREALFAAEAAGNQAARAVVEWARIRKLAGLEVVEDEDRYIEFRDPWGMSREYLIERARHCPHALWFASIGRFGSSTFIVDPARAIRKLERLSRKGDVMARDALQIIHSVRGDSGLVGRLHDELPA